MAEHRQSGIAMISSSQALDSTDSADSDTQAASNLPPDGVRLVGIGSSAGGLEALQELLGALPESDVLSYVIAQHLSPTYASTLSELLAAKTALRVLDLGDRVQPEAGTIYITPPNRDVIYRDGWLCLVEPQNAVGPKPSANNLFHSMAEGLGEAAIGIVLSGTGSDGASGLRDIKVAGGVTIAQEPGSAKYDGMPKAAILTGNVDLVMRPGQIGPVLLRLATEPREVAIAEHEGMLDAYTQIAHQVRLRTGFRLDEYKSGTVQRRIARRMGVLGVKTLFGYIEHMRAHGEEAQLLVRDTFISVTSFFRDRAAYDVLEETIGNLVQQADSGVIRCWVPGCATGEEAYSIAMLFEEALRAAGRADLQYVIFATDLDDDALDHARQASYPEQAFDCVPAIMRERYVEPLAGFGRIYKHIRNKLVFARQNVIDDPPFARMDLISCRNLLIYLNPPVQQRLFEVFHFSLKSGGHLFLGRSEAVDSRPELFVARNAKARLYVRVEGVTHYTLPASQVDPGRGYGARHPESARSSGTAENSLSQRLLENLARRYAPPSLVINQADNVVYLQGDLKPFLNFQSGRMDPFLFDMVDPAIRAELRALVYRCRRSAERVVGGSYPCRVEGRPHSLMLAVEALEPENPALLQVSFITRLTESMSRTEADAGDGSGNAVIIEELERELVNTRTHLNLVVEELETSNEELQSLNEELQSTNEELQSTNEELQTSNEELQSTNEELLTVNEELQVKSAELEITTSDLVNVKQSLDFPLIVVDAQLRITQSNEACSRVAWVGSPLEGMSLASVGWRFPMPGIEQDVQAVITGNPRKKAILPADGEHFYDLHIMPYRTAAQQIAGAVLLFEDISSAHQAEEALRASELRYRQVTESLPQLVWTCEADGPCDYLSPQWVSYTGIPEADQLGYAWFDQLHPDDRQRAIDHWTQTAGCGKNFEIEFRIRRHDGVYRWFHTQAVALRDDKGKILKWFGSNTDVDDHRQAEQVLQASEARLRRVIEVMPEVLLVVDKEGIIHHANSRLTEVLGYTVALLLGQHVEQLIPERFRENHPFLRRKYAEAPAVRPMGLGQELFAQHLDGHEVPVEIALAPLSGIDPVLIVVTIVDISQRLAREAELRASERRFRLMADCIRDYAIIFLDHDGVISSWNAGAQRITGYTGEEAIGRPVSIFYLPQDVATGVPEALLTRARAQQSVEDQGWRVRKDGEKFFADVITTAICDETGDLIGYAKITRDVTERKRLEDDLHMHQENLESLVKQRTADLNVAKEAAEAASRAKSTFLSMVSHELRTPINGIMGTIALASRRAHDPVLLDFLGKADRSARQLLTVINDVLDIARIEADRLTLASTPFLIAEVMEHVRDNLEDMAHDKGLELLFDFPDGEQTGGYLGDPARITQILINLVGNALKFTQTGSVKVHVVEREALPGRAFLCFEVTDTGIGIREADRARIFDSFEQGDNTTTRRFGGTGLGLALSRGLVSAMGGNIGVKSVFGEGSTFWFEIPAWHHARPLKPVNPETVESLASLLREEHAHARILLVEDEPLTQEIGRAFLTEAGLDVSVAEDGERALEMAGAQDFDLVLMDMNMPRMGGIEATSALRTLPKHGLTPIIALTANAFIEDRDRCIRAGMNDFISKPFTPEVLYQVILRWLQVPQGS